MTHTFGRTIFVGCVAGLATVAMLQAQTEEPSPTHERAAVMANCQSMMAGMKADHDKLDDLVAKMNAATGPLKIDQIAAVLTELVARQKAMRAHMTSMHPESAATAGTPKEQPEAGHEQHH